MTVAMLMKNTLTAACLQHGRGLYTSDDGLKSSDHLLGGRCPPRRCMANRWRFAGWIVRKDSAPRCHDHLPAPADKLKPYLVPSHASMRRQVPSRVSRAPRKRPKPALTRTCDAAIGSIHFCRCGYLSFGTSVRRMRHVVSTRLYAVIFRGTPCRWGLVILTLYQGLAARRYRSRTDNTCEGSLYFVPEFSSLEKYICSRPCIARPWQHP